MINQKKKDVKKKKKKRAVNKDIRVVKMKTANRTNKRCHVKLVPLQNVGKASVWGKE